MSDIYSQMADLGVKLADVDRRIREMVEPLMAEREDLKSAMDRLAADLVRQQGPAPGDGDDDDDELEDEGPPEGVPAVPPRRRRLLALLGQHPAAEYSVLSTAFYGEDTRASRGALSAELSGLRKLSLVKPVDRGRFVLTSQGQRLVANGGQTR